MSAQKKFVSSSLLLFLDSIVLGAGGWLYWLVMTKFTSSSEIGQATTVYSLIVLVDTLTQLSLEYPLLKKSSIERSRILGAALTIELAITLSVTPFVIFLLSNVYDENLQKYTWIAIVMLPVLAISFVSHFALLGVSNSKTILVVDTVATGMKLGIGYVLVAQLGYGSLGILLSFLIQALFIGGTTLFFSLQTFGIKFGDLKVIKETVKDGLANMPSKLSRTLIFSLSVVLLAYFGVRASEVGQFYIALLITVFVGSLVSSMAYMVIPASSISKRDLTSGSLRIGISVTSPMIAALLTSPTFILSLLGNQYLSAETILIVLAIAIFPLTIVTNAISKFNFSGNSKKLVLLGTIQLLVFLIFFFLLVPYAGTLGAALSILIAYSATSITAILWLDRILIKYILVSGIAIFIGYCAGKTLEVFLVGTGTAISNILPLIIALCVTLCIVMILKNISISEIRELVRISVGKKQ
jgi:O-antigen/teichoic acid export membrane protein